MIHPTAQIDPAAKLAPGVSVGAYAVIGPDVIVGEGTEISPHVVIKGPTHIGKHNKIYQFASIGEDCQDKKYAGERTELVIGDNNVIREYCNFNRGTVQGGGVTRIGSGNLFMAGVHIAHDCQLGSNIIIANNSSLAGHVTVKDFAILSGYIGIHQFCEIGEYSFISHAMMVTKDVPPFMLVAGGRRHKVAGINAEGLKRHQFTAKATQDIKTAFKILYKRELPLQEALVQIEALVLETPILKLMVDFIKGSKRGIIV